MTPIASAKLESLRVMLERRLPEERLDEASEVQLDELPPEKQKSVKNLASKLGLKVSSVFDGIHGNIVMFDVSGQSQPNWRLAASDLKLIANFKGLRWAELDAKHVTLGF